PGSRRRPGRPRCDVGPPDHHPLHKGGSRRCVARLRRPDPGSIRDLAVPADGDASIFRRDAPGVRMSGADVATASRSHAASERGSVSVLAAGIMVALVVLALGASDVARVLSAASRAQTAADAAALAAAQELAL